MAKTFPQSESEILRLKAKKIYKKKQSISELKLSERDTLKLIYDLEIHQIELEMQNEELIQFKKEVDAASARYLELYDFAPSGYCTISKASEILELNLACSQMLGKERLYLKNKKLAKFVSKDTSPIFNLFLEKVFNCKTREICEVTLIGYGKLPMHLFLTGIVGESREQCLLNMVDITERKKAEEATKVQMMNFYSVFDSSPVAMLVIDKKTNIVMANLEAVKLSGSNIADIINHRPGEALGCIQSSKDSRGCGYSKECKLCDIRNGIEGLIARGGNLHGAELEFKLLRKEKVESVWMNVGVEPLQLNGIMHWCVAMDDITDRKLAKDMLRKSEKRMEDIIHSLADWVWEVDEKGVYTYISQNGEQLFGLKNEEIIGKTPFDFMEPVEAQRVSELFTEISSGKKNIKDLENWNIGKDGQKICLLTNGVPKLDTEGNFKGFIGVDKDITERKNLELSLRTALDRSSAIINTSPNAIVVTDAAGTVSLWNKSAETMFGWTQEEAIGTRNLVNPLARIDELQRIRTLLISGESFKNGEAECIHKNGSIVSVKSSATLVRDGEGNITGILSLSDDITVYKKILKDLVHAKERAEESDRLKSAFLANMSHEIRTPMNGILGFADLLKEPNLQNEKQQLYISIIKKSGVRMLNIINDIISISKIESGQMSVSLSETNLNEQIEYVATFFRPEAEQKGMLIHFKNALPLKESIIMTDREKIYAILTNLVKNAIKFSNHGLINIGYDIVEEQHVEFLRFYVKDTGIGIPEDMQEVIFKRFIQVDVFDKMARQGAGLGLAISKAYVELLGGKIWVESLENAGSIFYFTIPYNAKTKKAIDKEDNHSSHSTEDNITNLKILIAEDDDVSELLISIEVKVFGTEILIARSGIEAVEACRKNPDIDLVLMDIEMPEMDGYEATRQIREFNKDIIIFAQTAYALNGDREKALMAGCNDYFTKPIQRETLAELVQQYFKQKED